MNHYTKSCGGAQPSSLIDNAYLAAAEGGFSGAAAERLARLEALYERLAAGQETLAKELEALRLAGKTRTTRFQQLLAKKLTEKNVIILLDTYVFDSTPDKKQPDRQEDTGHLQKS